MTTELYDEWIQASKWVADFFLKAFSWIKPLAMMTEKVLTQGALTARMKDDDIC